MTAFFDDNKFNYAPKINAEANRADGFTVLGLGYTTPGESAGLVAQDFIECQREKGWPLYRTNPALTTTPFNTQAATWNAANPDTTPPVWDSTAATSADSDPGTPGNQPPTPRTGIQEVIAGNGSATVRWDIARDQTGPVKYHLYYTSAPVLDFATATKLSNITAAIPQSYLGGTGTGRFPHEYQVGGLANGTTYRFAIRAADQLGHEDANIVTLATTPTGGPGYYKTIAVDGDDADWADVPVLATDPTGDGTPDILSVKIANDAEYVYLLVRYNGAVDTNTFIHLYPPPARRWCDLSAGIVIRSHHLGRQPGPVLHRFHHPAWRRGGKNCHPPQHRGPRQSALRPTQGNPRPVISWSMMTFHSTTTNCHSPAASSARQAPSTSSQCPITSAMATSIRIRRWPAPAAVISPTPPSPSPPPPWPPPSAASPCSAAGRGENG